MSTLSERGKRKTQLGQPTAPKQNLKKGSQNLAGMVVRLPLQRQDTQSSNDPSIFTGVNKYSEVGDMFRDGQQSPQSHCK